MDLLRVEGGEASPTPWPPAELMKLFFGENGLMLAAQVWSQTYLSWEGHSATELFQM